MELQIGVTGSRIGMLMRKFCSLVAYKVSLVQGNTSKANFLLNGRNKTWNKINELFMHIIKSRILFILPNIKYKIQNTKCNCGMERKERKEKDSPLVLGLGPLVVTGNNLPAGFQAWHHASSPPSPQNCRSAGIESCYRLPCII